MERRTSRIRRRRAQEVADTTDSLRAVACIRFVRLGWFSGAVHVSALSELDGGSSTVHEVESRDSGAVVELDGSNAVAMVVSVKCANRRSS